MSAAGYLQQVPAAGGTPTPVTALQEGDESHRWPVFLPDGEHFLFLALGKNSRQLRVGSLSSTASTPLGSIRTNALYASGHLLYLDDSQILTARPFDLRARQLTGAPVPLNVRVDLPPQYPGRGTFAVSERGWLVYREQRFLESHLTWRDRKGTPVSKVGAPASYANLRLSSDDQQVAVSRRGPGGSDIWTMQSRDGDEAKLTTDPALEHDPAWSPDGRYIIFTSNRRGVWSLFQRPSDGSGNDTLVVEGEAKRGYSALDWSPDGRFMLFDTTGGDLWMHTVGTTSASMFLGTNSSERSPGFSPDGQYVVYSSDKTGRHEVYVRAFPSGEPELKISREGGWHPRWRSDGEIFFLSLDDGTMMSSRAVGKAIPSAPPQTVVCDWSRLGSESATSVRRHEGRTAVSDASIE